jgi:hypothetical protein
MKTNPRKRLTGALLAALATIGSLHAPLHAQEASATGNEVRAEIVRTGHEAAPALALERSAAAAFERASEALQAELNIDLELRLGSHAAQAVADNELDY